MLFDANALPYAFDGGSGNGTVTGDSGVYEGLFIVFVILFVLAVGAVVVVWRQR